MTSLFIRNPDSGFALIASLRTCAAFFATIWRDSLIWPGESSPVATLSNFAASLGASCTTQSMSLKRVANPFVKLPKNPNCELGKTCRTTVSIRACAMSMQTMSAEPGVKRLANSVNHSKPKSPKRDDNGIGRGTPL